MKGQHIIILFFWNDSASRFRLVGNRGVGGGAPSRTPHLALGLSRTYGLFAAALTPANEGFPRFLLFKHLQWSELERR
jgi:hypothetical protein